MVSGAGILFPLEGRKIMDLLPLFRAPSYHL
jgi:hypothetical protein